MNIYLKAFQLFQNLTAMYNVIFHLDETSKTWLSLQNIANLIIAMETNYTTIELLVNGEAVTELIQSNQAMLSTMLSLHKRGVIFAACAHSLHHARISPTDLFEFVTIVPSGVAELVQKQSQGWAYIKP